MANIRYSNVRNGGVIQSVNFTQEALTYGEFVRQVGYSGGDGDRITILNEKMQIVNRSGADASSPLSLSESTLLRDGYTVQVTPGKSGGGVA